MTFKQFLDISFSDQGFPQLIIHMFSVLAQETYEQMFQKKKGQIFPYAVDPVQKPNYLAALLSKGQDWQSMKEMEDL